MNRSFRRIFVLLLLTSVPTLSMAQLEDQAVSFSYRFGMGKIPYHKLDTDSEIVPHAYTGGKRWGRSNEFDVTWHFIPNLGASLQLGGSAFRIDTLALEKKLLERYTGNFVNTMIPRDYRFVDLAIGPTGFFAIDKFYIQTGALIGTTFQSKFDYDVYLYDYRGYPSHTYQYHSRGPAGWMAEGNCRIGFLTDGDVRLGFFAGGSYRYIHNRVKVNETHLDAGNRNVTTRTEKFTMDVQIWQVQIGMQVLLGG